MPAKIKVTYLVDGNFNVKTDDQEFSVSVAKDGSISRIETTSPPSKELKSDNSIYIYLEKYVNDMLSKKTKFKELEQVGKFMTYINMVDMDFDGVNYKPYSYFLEMNGEMAPVTPELIANLKESMTKKESLKLDLVTKPMSIDLGNRVLLYGPTGTGKTYDFIAATKQLIADGKLDADGVEIVTITDGLEDIDFLAHIIPGPSGITHVETRIVGLLRAAAHGKKIAILLDELNRGAKSLNNFVLKMLDPVNGETYVINNFIKDEQIVVPMENILFFAAMNLGSKYVGTTALDEALTDRFNVVQFKGYDEEVESEIRAKAFGTFADKVGELVKYVREIHQSGEIRSPISTRGVKMWGEAFLETDGSVDALVAMFHRTLMYRIISVDEIGIPNEQEKIQVERQIKTIFGLK